jgi:anaerobic ribonucleoside-triphosphate reductase activating protein
MKIRLNRAHYPVTALGPGRRVGLWLQGCHVGCPGCASRDTWAPDPAREIEIDRVLAWCRAVAPGGCDGVTISGGEPFEQHAALVVLLRGLDIWRREFDRPADILCYSGLPFRRLQREHADILARLDAVIPEPYVDRLPRGKLWRGSANQPLVLLSPLGRERYAAAYVEAEPGGKGAFQLSVEDGTVLCIGIPDRGDMTELESAAQRRGVELRDVSWRA